MLIKTNVLVLMDCTSIRIFLNNINENNINNLKGERNNLLLKGHARMKRWLSAGPILQKSQKLNKFFFKEFSQHWIELPVKSKNVT